MFTPRTKKSQLPHRKETNEVREATDSPSTPFLDNSSFRGAGPPRPATGTPAPWIPRNSFLARVPSSSRTRDGAEPVFVAEFPLAVRDAQSRHKTSSGFCGGIEKGLSLAWIVCGNQIFIWNFLQSPRLKKCLALDIPTSFLSEDEAKFSKLHWLISFIDWGRSGEILDNVGVVACCQERGGLIYWADASLRSIDEPNVFPPITDNGSVSSILVSPISNYREECIILTLSSNGELWCFCCSPTEISGERVSTMNTVYAKSLTWNFQNEIQGKDEREFLLLTDHEIQCWKVVLEGSGHVSKLWSHELIGINSDLSEKNRLLFLDLQADYNARIFQVLVATLFDNYTEYSLLSLRCRPACDVSSGRILERDSPLHVLIPKGRVEEVEGLLSMRLRIGGKSSESVVILSRKGNATVVRNCRNNSLELFQFELPWDAGKVLDASSLASMTNVEVGDWVFLTEKAGIWAIPKLENINPEDSQRSTFLSNTQNSLQDEEAEALLGSLFNDFLLDDKVEGVLEKLKKKGAFEKEGSMNVFARVSQSIVDTLAKHWTTTRGSDLLSSAVYSSQLVDKQLKHKRFLQFLALSKCHAELSSRQRKSLLIILEHGEKLSSMIELRELQSQISQEKSGETRPQSSPSLTMSSSSLWDLIQLVGEKTRRNSVLLMDRDNAEVFYSRVSDIEDLFYCLSHNLQFIADGESSVMDQTQRISEVSNAAASIIHSAIQYRNDHHAWYPSLEGLSHWNCGPVVRSGLWSIIHLIIRILDEATTMDKPLKHDLSSCLEKLSEIYLEGYDFSVGLKIERDKDYEALLEEYCTRRDEILHAMYKRMKDSADKKYQETSRGAEDPELRKSIFKETSGRLLEISKRHEGYQTLWNLCFDLDNTELLRSLMRQSVGPQGGFSYFVFEQLYGQERYSALLKLGEEFQEELLIFLQKHKELLWLHEIFLNQFSPASENLHYLGHHQENRIIDLTHSKKELSLSDRRRLLNLSKIAGAASGRDFAVDHKMQRVEADLHLLELQEKITSQLTEEEEGKEFNKLLEPEKLIELCLKKSNTGESQLLEAFEIFALSSSTFRASNKSRLAECWTNAIDQDDWVKMHHDSMVNGWGDDMIMDVLKGTVLYQASQRCYGPNAYVYDGGFNDVLPLLRDDVEASLKMPLSVEGILMKHASFPDAGKLMVTALVMGRLGSDAVLEGDVMSEV